MTQCEVLRPPSHFSDLHNMDNDFVKIRFWNSTWKTQILWIAHEQSIKKPKTFFLQNVVFLIHRDAKQQPDNCASSDSH